MMTSRWAAGPGSHSVHRLAPAWGLSSRSLAAQRILLRHSLSAGSQNPGFAAPRPGSPPTPQANVPLAARLATRSLQLLPQGGANQAFASWSQGLGYNSTTR
jgi:hypothetical protein